MEALKQVTRVSPKTALTATAALIALSGTAYSITLYRRLSLTSHSLIKTTESASESFRKSATIRGLVNPRGHTAWEDSRSVALAVPEGVKLPSEELLLSRFVRVFFGGRVFLFERIGLQLLRKQLVVFDGMLPHGLAPSSVPEYVNSVSGLPTSLPSLHSVFWGTFQVTDLRVGEDGEGSSIDFVYGSNRGEFAGCHRFTVRKETGGQGERVFVSMECMTCNPRVDKPVSGQFLFGLHKVYAMMLFRDAVAEVKDLLS
ncbi:hypothetical protein MGU_09481 [Metarhizium guizhouense ARSEF 977]|uniref:Uncharacterized protein n=1 Tax=Metarhizium guizhouense (strain ARSEF 977) TaxID=1276136 RepID=A0A0B4G913_METGA|nr:hypothetical protein MGU_09481 [Metarhizium guizhouense ARSEF 977]